MKGYIPSNEDILQGAVQRSDVQIEASGVLFSFLMLGSPQLNWNKLRHYIEEVICVLFIVDSSAYDQTSLTDSTANQLKESLALFDAIVNNEHFQSTSFALFFVKTNILEEKIKRSNIKDYFPEFEVSHSTMHCLQE